MLEKKKMKKIRLDCIMGLNFCACLFFTITFKKNGTSKAKLEIPTKLEVEFDKEKTSELYNEFDKLDMHKWKKEYESDYPILDGETWNLYIEYEDGTKEHKNGYNKFPKTYRKLYNLGKSLFSE